MDNLPIPTGLIPCAMPGCAAITPLATSIYIDGRGHVCPGCTSPLPAWAWEIDPPW